MNSLVYKKVKSETISKISIELTSNMIAPADGIKLGTYRIGKVTITIYKNGTVFFQGDGCEQYAQKWFKTEDKTNQIDYFQPNIIGNDEVGVGDIFGPLVVTSSYVGYEQIAAIKNMNIKDSKQLEKKDIYELAEKLITLVPHKTIVLSNHKYNSWYLKYKNSHVIKALVHNQCLLMLLQKSCADNYQNIIIDEFASGKNYYNYLAGETDVVKSKVLFMTKGESKHCAVAISSIISRYYFLEAIKMLENEYHISLPLGANNHVKTLAQQYINELGKDACDHLLKTHFNIAIK